MMKEIAHEEDEPVQKKLELSVASSTKSATLAESEACFNTGLVQSPL